MIAFFLVAETCVKHDWYYNLDYTDALFPHQKLQEIIFITHIVSYADLLKGLGTRSYKSVLRLNDLQLESRGISFIINGRD